MNEVQERLTKFIEYLNISISQFEQRAKLANGFVSNTNARMRNSSKNLISTQFPELNMEWLIRGNGEMLNKVGGDVTINSRNIIPFYDDVATIGGVNCMVANLESSNNVEYIDTGDWFNDATSAIRHYGDSMVEYPSGSILALKRVQDTNLLIWGRNYCIETTEFRITKRLQNGGDDYVIAYSSNTETYPDGTLIHSPIKIPKESIRHIDLVLGCVTKEYSNNLL